MVTGAKEIEVDAVAKNGELVVTAISVHIENAGVHSGDASIMHPAQDLSQEVMDGVTVIARKVAKMLEISGPFNIQILCKDDYLKVIECNLRASRSFPFVSKTKGVDMISIATQVCHCSSCTTLYHSYVIWLPDHARSQPICSSREENRYCWCQSCPVLVQPLGQFRSNAQC